MRSLLVAVVMVIIASAAMPNSASAVGYYRVGEPPACSSLVARGLVPDTVNQLTEAFPLHYVASALDSIAVDVRSFLEQMAQKPEAEVVAAAPTKSEAAAEIDQPAPAKPAPTAAKVQKKPVPVPKVTKDKNTPVKTTAKKKTTTTKPKTPPKPEPAQ